MSAPPSLELGPRAFALFRVVLGLYVVVHLGALVPWAGEVWSAAGVLPDRSLVPLPRGLPNALDLLRGPGLVQAFVALLAALAALFTAGIARRPAAALLLYGWACLLERTPLISNPSIPYVGFGLLLSLAVPPGERLARGAAPGWRTPPGALAAAWLVFAASYTYAGVTKLGAPSWLDGSALSHVLACPLARDSWLREALVALPAPLMRAATWSTLALELLALPLCLAAAGRRAAWLGLTGLHLGTLAALGFADLSLGMLAFHLLVCPWLGTLDDRVDSSGQERSACATARSSTSSPPSPAGARSSPPTASTASG